jgi:hypothetical protein
VIKPEADFKGTAKTMVLGRLEEGGDRAALRIGEAPVY